MRSTGPLIVAAYLLALGCAPPYRIAPREVHFTPDSAADPYWAKAAPRDPKTVVTTDGDLSLPYKRMGRFTVASVGLDTNISTGRLRDEAALRGLDAVIHIKTEKTSKGGSSNEAINYFFPAKVSHVIEGVGVLLAEHVPAEEPAPVAAPPSPEPPPPAPAPAPEPPKPEPPPPAPAPAPEPPPPAPAPAPAPVAQPKSEPPPPAPAPPPAAPPAPPPAAPPAAPPPAASESKHEPLPPADVFTEEHK